MGGATQGLRGLEARQAGRRDELIDHCRARIARYKCSEGVEFVAELPKTSTGKVQKYSLREREWAGQAARIRG